MNELISSAQACPTHHEVLTETLHRLNDWVKIPSDIENTRNIFKLQEMIARELEVLGFDIDFIARGNVAAMIASTPLARSGINGITLVGHVDTALCGGGEIEIGQEWSNAIGVGDDKGGVMVGLRALEKLGRNMITELPLRFVLSPNEESGSPGFHELFREISSQSFWVLGLEPALASGDLIDSRCGNRWYHMKYQGIGAHAGRFGEPHANPVHAIASLVARLAPLNDDSAKRRVNATDIRVAPGIVNAIPDSAELKLDARFANSFDQKLIDGFIRESLTEHEKVTVELNLLDDCPPMERKGPEWFYKAAMNAIHHHEGQSICCKSTGGASDANHFSHAKMGVIDGLGPIAKGMHTPNEAILNRTLETRSSALRDLIQTLGDTHA